MFFKITRLLLTSNYKLVSWQPKIFKMSSHCGEDKPIESKIYNKLTQEFAPTHLQVRNESYMHNVPKGSETHFKVLLVSEKFEGLPPIKRHRLVYEILENELSSGVHALSIDAKTPSQWSPEQQMKPSPNCKGGFGK